MFRGILLILDSLEPCSFAALGQTLDRHAPDESDHDSAAATAVWILSINTTHFILSFYLSAYRLSINQSIDLYHGPRRIFEWRQ